MDIDRIRLILNIAFMVGAVASVVLYFAMPENTMPMFIVCVTAIVLKFAEYVLRMFQNAIQRNRRHKK